MTTERRLLVFVILVAILFATGCSTPLGMFGGAEELATLSRIKDANVVCIEADVMLGANKGALVLASVDKGISATIIVDARGKCAVVVKTEK